MKYLLRNNLEDFDGKAVKRAGVVFEYEDSELKRLVSEVAEDHFEAGFRLSSLPRNVQNTFKLGPLAWPAVLQNAIDAGIIDSGELADILFYLHHPERKGRPISKSEPNYPQLVKEWKNFRRLANIQLDYRKKKSAPQNVAAGGSDASCKVSGKRVVCGDCVIVEKRAQADLPLHTVFVRPDLRFNKGKQLRLRPEVEAAWAKLVAAARRDGISTPYLKIRSAFRSYPAQSLLWRNRLTGVFRKMGCQEPVLSCIWTAAGRTNKALKNVSIPHPKSAWISRFRKELSRLGCRPTCPDGGTDSISVAVKRLARWTARPGRSKHHSGRALDVYLGSNNNKANVSKQRRTEAFRWLVCNAARFGFSNYIVEPWHWEYIRQ